MTLRRPLVPTLVVLCLTLALTSHFLPPDASADDGYQEVAQVVSRPVWDRMRPIHRQLIRSIVENNLDPSRARMAACWEASPSNYELVEAFNAAMSLGADPSQEFQLSNRWTNTTSGTSGVQGVPTTLTYSFVPDGTSIPSTGTTDPSGVSNLFAWLNGIYGSPAVWQQIFADEFARYANLTGLSYVHETNDDGVPMFGSGGSAGSRGDVRIGARMIDGNSGILAYDYYPNNGDMVLDAYDSFFNSTSSNSLRLRNVVAHEHGHGMGMAHVCPANETK
ncbi:MAG: matrixin family metalloprotease, partial [Salinibacterium sp.]|nr:matrixin family metalloprotease [Salinibacterium sp.]